MLYHYENLCWAAAGKHRQCTCQVNEQNCVTNHGHLFTNSIYSEGRKQYWANIDAQFSVEYHVSKAIYKVLSPTLQLAYVMTATSWNPLQKNLQPNFIHYTQKYLQPYEFRPPDVYWQITCNACAVHTSDGSLVFLFVPITTFWRMHVSTLRIGMTQQSLCVTVICSEISLLASISMHMCYMNFIFSLHFIMSTNTHCHISLLPLPIHVQRGIVIICVCSLICVTVHPCCWP